MLNAVLTLPDRQVRATADRPEYEKGAWMGTAVYDHPGLGYRPTGESSNVATGDMKDVRKASINPCARQAPSDMLI